MTLAQARRRQVRRPLRIIPVSVVMFVPLVLASGCMLLCPDPSPARQTSAGEIEMCDYSTCRHMRVVEHKFEHRGGRLVVSVTWLNVTDEPYLARIRVGFYDERGLCDTGSFRWDLVEFPPGPQPTVFTPYSKQAVRYRIELADGG